MMNVKVLKIRLNPEQLQQDQTMLDEFLSRHEIVKFESAFVSEKECYWSVILYYNESAATIAEIQEQNYEAEDQLLSEEEIHILESLKIWRSEKAREHKLPSYCIATNKELFSVAKCKPVRKEELKEIKGFGKHKIEHYGEEIIDILEST